MLPETGVPQLSSEQSVGDVWSVHGTTQVGTTADRRERHVLLDMR